MASAVCTVFEGHFHKGVAVLVNSLYNNGFRGNIYAGYRGALPGWSNSAIDNLNLGWPGAKTLQPAKELQVHFLPVVTDFHLAHYKPDFMLRLLEGPAKDAETLAYFDPDIVVLCSWNFFRKWISFGVAMVHEAVSNDMPATHPIRMEWCKIIQMMDRELKRNINSYINCGFCGIARKNIEFLHLWSRVIKLAIREYKMNPATFIEYDRTTAFYSIDQDAFNIAAMCCECPISEMGPEAMDFVGAGWTMSHATGWPKPWKNRFVLSALGGNPPSRPHKNYWNNTKKPLRPHSNLYTALVRAEIFVGSLIGRFYKRN